LSVSAAVVQVLAALVIHGKVALVVVVRLWLV
jgi:hypothetical protein